MWLILFRNPVAAIKQLGCCSWDVIFGCFFGWLVFSLFVFFNFYFLPFVTVRPQLFALSPVNVTVFNGFVLATLSGRTLKHVLKTEGQRVNISKNIAIIRGPNFFQLLIKNLNFILRVLLRFTKNLWWGRELNQIIWIDPCLMGPTLSFWAL